jgi:hypothetical protein
VNEIRGKLSGDLLDGMSIAGTWTVIVMMIYEYLIVVYNGDFYLHQLSFVIVEIDIIFVFCGAIKLTFSSFLSWEYVVI